MRRRRNCWLASSLLLLTLSVAQVPAQARSAETDTTRWLLRVNKFLVLEGDARHPADNRAELRLLRRADQLRITFVTADSARLKHVVELIDARGEVVKRFHYESALTDTFELPVAELVASRGVLSGVYSLRYLNSRGDRRELAVLLIGGTD